jgi:hypothetical protein
MGLKLTGTMFSPALGLKSVEPREFALNTGRYQAECFGLGFVTEPQDVLLAGTQISD